MKIQFNILLLSIALFCSCSSKKPETKVTQLTPVSDKNNLLDSTNTDSYVGFINRYYFQKTDEFYVELYFKQDKIEEDEYSRIAGSGDSTIFKDEENRRTRIQLKIASQKFDFRGLDTLSLFDKNNRFLTIAHFVRVEYLDQNISPVFTAVYKADKPDLTDKAIYCVGNLHDKVVADNYISIEDTTLTKEIEQKLGFSHKFDLDGMHYRTKENNSISIINIDTTAMIVEKRNESIKILYQSKVSENIFDIVFVPIIRNFRPIILAKCVMPDTDVEWNELFIFNGNQYQSSDRQRIKN